jgi:hypothetical protein
MIEESEIPPAVDPSAQDLLDIYTSEINKVVSVWRSFDDALL